MMINLFFTCANFIRRKMQRLLNTATIGVKALIINEHKEVMLVEHTYMQGWHLPGGGVNPSETPIEAIIREVQEETGLIVKQTPSLFAIYTHLICGASDYPLLYVITQFASPPKVKLCREIKQACWFDINNLPPNTTESTRLRIQEVLKSTPAAPHW
ncbi:MAG: NUDIX domain-containing protein [Candidatus Berkiella sp.]